MLLHGCRGENEKVLSKCVHVPNHGHYNITFLSGSLFTYEGLLQNTSILELSPIACIISCCNRQRTVEPQTFTSLELAITNKFQVTQSSQSNSTTNSTSSQECNLTDSFGFLIQFLLATIAFSILVLKRYR